MKKLTVLFFILGLSTSTSLAQEAPVIEWAKSMGGTQGDFGQDIAIDASGNVYSTGIFWATADFDSGPAVFNLTTPGGDHNVFVSKLDVNGNFVWAKSLGGSNTDYGHSIAVDASGNVITTGYFSGTADFDPGPAVFNLTSSGANADMFISKLDTDGNFVWAINIGANFIEYGYGVTVDDAGNIYVTGLFRGVVDFDPGAGVSNLTSIGTANNTYILKLDTDSNFIWAKSFAGSMSNYGSDVFVDDMLSVYTVGYYIGTTDFDPGAGVSNLIASGIEDAFIVKLDMSGNFIWARSMGGTSNTRVENITVDAGGAIYTTGFFVGTTDLNPGAGTDNHTAAGTTDIFISKLDASGNFVWGKAMGGVSNDYGLGIDTDALGNVYTSGYFRNTVDFDPGPGVFNITSVGGYDIFLSKLDSNGNHAWTVRAGANTTYDDAANALTIDPSGTIYLAGNFAATVDFDFGTCAYNLISAGESDVFVQKIKLGTVVSPPTITSFTPTTGPIGTSVVITGTNFGTIPAENSVAFFNNRPATVTASDATSITTSVPAGTTTGKISVTTNCITVISTTDFTIGATLLPTITSFTPTSGPVGATVTITGTNFSTTPTNNIVAFNGTAAVVTASTTTSITTSVPTGATTGTIAVTVAGNTATSATDFTVGTSQNFITRWNLATSGSGATQLSFGTATSGVVNYTWQELSPGTATGSGSWSGATLSITGLPTGATIRLQISPTNFQRIIINNGADRNRLTQVEQWGSTAWTSMQLAFYRCANLQVTATDLPNLSGVTDMSQMFRGCTVLNSPANIGSWNTTTVINMSGVFSDTNTFNQDIGAWNTTTVTNMSGMFTNALAFNRNIGTWNTAAVTTMASMFSGATAFNQDIGAWNTSFVTNMSGMFSGAIVFNRNIGAWNTAAVTNMNSMFFSAYVFNQNISGWNTAAVTNMSGMFGYAYAFNQNIGTWNTSAVTNMSSMFIDAFNFNQNIGTWNTSAVTTMRSMFIDAYDFNQNIGAWNTSAVTDMERMFDFATAFNQNIGAWNTAAVTNMRGMFADASSFNQNLGIWTLNPAVNLSNMLNNTSMDCNNYSATLIGWSTNPSTPNGRILGATGRQYGTNAAAVRTNLTTTKGWTITGDTPSGTACELVLIPTITNFTPASGSIGTTVTITGTNFSTTPANNTVTFNGTTAVVTASTATSITTTAPTGASTGKISVTVAGNTAISAADFIVASVANEPPIIQPTATAVPVDGIITIDLLPLISDPDDNLDLSTLSLVSSITDGGATATLVGATQLELNYGNVAFAGTDRISISVCDLLSACTEQELSIEVSSEIKIYNGLSPNDDQLNPIFLILYIGLLPDTQNNKVSIYNRWGSKVWEGTNYDNDQVKFDGETNSGNELPSGTYFFKIEFAGGRKTETGYLSLKR